MSRDQTDKEKACDTALRAMPPQLTSGEIAQFISHILVSYDVERSTIPMLLSAAMGGVVKIDERMAEDSEGQASTQHLN